MSKFKTLLYNDLNARYSNSGTLAQIKAFLRVYCGRKLEYLGKTDLSDLVATYHFMNLHKEWNLGRISERPEH